MVNLEHENFKKKVQEALDKNGFSCDLSGEVQWSFASGFFMASNGFQKTTLSHDEIQKCFDACRDKDIALKKHRSNLKKTIGKGVGHSISSAKAKEGR